MANGAHLFALSLPRSHRIIIGSVCNFPVLDLLLSVLTHWREPSRISELQDRSSLPRKGSSVHADQFLWPIQLPDQFEQEASAGSSG